MNPKFLIILLLIGMTFMSCQTLHGDPPLTLEAVSLAALPSNITSSQDLNLRANVIFKGSEGDPAKFRVEFLNGLEVIASGNVSNSNSVEKTVPITKAMNGILQLKAKVSSSESPTTTVESQVVSVTVNIL
jgi:hypothetical protein